MRCNVPVILACWTATGVLLAGCATPRSSGTAEVSSTLTPVAERPKPTPEPTPPPQAKPRYAARPPAERSTAAPSAKPADKPPGDSVADLIKASTSWLDDGKTLSVTRENAGSAAPVPLFRQAIVLAAVRAAMAGLPAEPRAEFQRGLITLTFGQGSSAQIADAVNRAISVPEVHRLRVVLP